jgi:hypothetical protein
MYDEDNKSRAYANEYKQIRGLNLWQITEGRVTIYAWRKGCRDAIMTTPARRIPGQYLPDKNHKNHRDAQ